MDSIQCSDKRVIGPIIRDSKFWSANSYQIVNLDFTYNYHFTSFIAGKFSGLKAAQMIKSTYDEMGVSKSSKPINI